VLVPWFAGALAWRLKVWVVVWGMFVVLCWLMAQTVGVARVMGGCVTNGSLYTFARNIGYSREWGRGEVTCAAAHMRR